MGMEPISWALMAASAAATGVSLYKGQQADKQARKAADLSRRQEAFKALRERRDFIRSARTTAARITQGAENAGAANTSAAQGGLASIISQAGSGLSFLDQYNAFSTQIGAASSKSAKFSSQANMWGGVADLAASGAKMNASGAFGGGKAPTVKVPYGPTES
jgi:hypothetical protein